MKIEYTISPIQLSIFFSQECKNNSIFKLELNHETKLGKIHFFHDNPSLPSFIQNTMGILISNQNPKDYDFQFFKLDGFYYSIIFGRYENEENRFMTRHFEFEMENDVEMETMYQEKRFYHYCSEEKDLFLWKKECICVCCQKKKICMCVHDHIQICSTCFLAIFEVLQCF